MDIIRGNLDGISRPASNSRIYPESRSSSASLEVLTPEPVSIKVDTSINSNNNNLQNNKENCTFRESSSNNDVSKIKETDQQLKEAVKKMKRLDKLLVEKQFKEKEIKKQGQEMRTKLWEELRTIKNFDVIQSNEEIENTKKFVSLAASSEGTTDPFHPEQEDSFVSVFHTQIPAEEYENCIEQARKESVYQSENNKSLIKPEKKSQRENCGEFKGKKNQDFIKKNIELAKDSKSLVFMMDKEKRRLIELLKDIDSGEDVLPSTEETVLKDSTQVKVTPGDKILQSTKEHRIEKNRLKEIDQQLKELEEDFVRTPRVLSEEQLKTLLEECILEQRSEKESRDADGVQPESIQPSKSFIAQLLNVLPALSSPEVENEDFLENGECETPGYYLTKALGNQHHIAEFLVTETKEAESPWPPGNVASGDVEHYFMSKTLGIGRLKRPSFLDDPLYCMDSSPSSEDENLKLIDFSTESPPNPDELTTEVKTEEEEEDRDS
ncbi:fibrous sheath-interacting protein 1 isoform X2 [Antechinus flavipes]|uniref:fibrous sheath-interacting protein 1 isoform X2 n=1 Tax=Antechinus flavipes TaxID=38775 RepID=UPI002235E377|nr:fibrous sheath-interacting protein 1 isoform X2 [Antechinus flavipes]